MSDRPITGSRCGHRNADSGWAHPAGADGQQRPDDEFWETARFTQQSGHVSLAGLGGAAVEASAGPEDALSDCSANSDAVISKVATLAQQDGRGETQYVFHQRTLPPTAADTSIAYLNMCVTGGWSPNEVDEIKAKVLETGASTALVSQVPRWQASPKWLAGTSTKGGTVTIDLGKDPVKVTGSISFGSGGENVGGTSSIKGAGSSNTFSQNNVWARWNYTCGSFCWKPGSTTFKGTVLNASWRIPSSDVGHAVNTIDIWTNSACDTKYACDQADLLYELRP